MNKIIIIAVFIFWVAVSVFFANNLINKKSVDYNQQDQAVNLPTVAQTGESFSFELVARHNTAGDCWVTSGNTVYNVTNYLNSHPGGRNAIVPYCGQDIAAAFAAQGHSNNAAKMLVGLAIGTIGQAIDNIDTAPTDNTNSNNSNNQPNNAVVPSGQTLTLALVAQHNTASDCWVMSGNTVYNVTNYLSQHPGGRNRIIPYCGQDIAAAFAAQGHSNNAGNILAGLEIGTIGQTISADPATTTPPPVNNNQRGDDDDEEEDD